MIRLLYIAGGAVGTVVLMAAVLLLTYWVHETFGWVGNFALAALVLVAGGGHLGAMLYKSRRR